MQFLVMVKSNPKAEAGEMPTKEAMEKMGAFNDELVKSGAFLGAGGLLPTSKSSRIKWDDGKPTVIDGPFAETKELVAGFWLLQFKSQAEAVQWMSRAPFEGDEQIEIRALHDFE